MAKKGGQASLQVEVNNDDEWETLLDRQGLVVCDVYTEWCGPCVGMMSNLKKVKLEIGSDQLHLAMANSDRITKLERFRGRSEPTWLFIGTGQLLKVMYGCNAPLLMKEIAEELVKEVECLDGKRERVFYPFDQLTPDEKKKMAEYEAKKAAELAKEKAELEARKDKVKRRYLGRIARKFINFSLVVFFPNVITTVIEDGAEKKTSPAAYKLMSMYDTVGLSIVDQLEVQLNKDNINELLYNSGYNLPEKLYDSILKEEIIVSLVQMIHPIKIPQPAAPNEQAPSPSTSHLSINQSVGLDIVEENLSLLVYGPAKKPTQATPESFYKLFETIDQDGNVLPPCWTPREHISKCAAACVIFPTRIEAFGIKEIEVPPRSFIMVFEGDRAQELLDVAKPFSSEVVHLGYFDSSNPAEAKKVCNTIYELEEMPDELYDNTKVVIALSKEKSEPTLILTQFGPLYVSPDMETAEKEVEMFFPPAVMEEEDLKIDPWGPPPPPPPPIWIDENGNEYLEIYITNIFGESRRVRKLVKLADGTEVEDGDVLDIDTEEVLDIEDREKREFLQRRIRLRKEREQRRLDRLKKLKAEEEGVEEMGEEEVEPEVEVEEEKVEVKPEEGMDEADEMKAMLTKEQIEKFQQLEREVLEPVLARKKKEDEVKKVAAAKEKEAAKAVEMPTPLFTDEEAEAFERELAKKYEYLNFITVLPGYRVNILQE